jgi:hypothetical protein
MISRKRSKLWVKKLLRQADIIGIIERKVMPNEYQDYFS